MRSLVLLFCEHGVGVESCLLGSHLIVTLMRLQAHNKSLVLTHCCRLICEAWSCCSVSTALALSFSVIVLCCGENPTTAEAIRRLVSS